MMPEVEKAGRPNQRRRTRKDLLQAAARLMKQGRKPTLEEVAEEALVSRATAYRYFQSVEPLLVEATLDVATPQPQDVFRPGLPDDPVSRTQRVDRAFHEMIMANEASLRIMLARSLDQSVTGDAEGNVPRRQNRRSLMIEAALEPSRHQFPAKVFEKLKQALAMVIGTEAMIVFKDVLQVDDETAMDVKQWAIRALVEGAMREKSPS
jgi:AcrR family transcriptional regulator